MIYLLLSILSSSVIFITFEVSERFKTNLIKLITVNYLIAALLGFSFNRHPVSITGALSSEWLPFALLIGLFFDPDVFFDRIFHTYFRSGRYYHRRKIIHGPAN